MSNFSFTHILRIIIYQIKLVVLFGITYWDWVINKKLDPEAL